MISRCATVAFCLLVIIGELELTVLRVASLIPFRFIRGLVWLTTILSDAAADLEYSLFVLLRAI